MAALVAAAVLLAPRLRSQKRVKPVAVTHERWMAVYSAITHDLTLVRDPARTPSVTRRAPCVRLPQWALQIGERDDELLMLDPKEPAILLLPRDHLRRVAEGKEACGPEDPSPVHRVPLHSGKVPYRGIIDGDRILISFFGDNLVEEYTWVAHEDGTGGATVMFVRDIRFAAGENLGLSDLLVVGHRLLVAASGYFCFARNCPHGHFHDSHLYSIPHKNALWPFVDARPTNVNASGLYRHPSGDVWLLIAGDYSGGYGSVARVSDVDPPTLEAEVRLPRNAAPGSAYAIGADRFAVLQFSGEHLFLFDARDGRLTRILRFDGTAFQEVPRDVAALPDRSSSDFQQVLADPDHPGDFYFVDSKREQLLRVHVEGESLAVKGSIPLADGSFRRSPSWAVWL